MLAANRKKVARITPLQATPLAQQAKEYVSGCKASGKEDVDKAHSRFYAPHGPHNAGFEYSVSPPNATRCASCVSESARDGRERWSGDEVRSSGDTSVLNETVSKETQPTQPRRRENTAARQPLIHYAIRKGSKTH